MVLETARPQLPSTTYLIVAFIVGCCVFYFFTRRIRDTTRYPHGPTPLPILGNLLYFQRLLKSPDPELISLAKQYGEIAMLWFGHNPVVVVNSPKVAKDLMDKVPDNSLMSFFML